MNDKLKNKILYIACAIWMLIVVILIVCIGVLQNRANNLQTQIEQYVETEEVNLLPCPICSHEVELKPIDDSFYRECEQWGNEDGCGLTTGFYKSKNELIEQWNGMK